MVLKHFRLTPVLADGRCAPAGGNVPSYREVVGARWEQRSESRVVYSVQESLDVLRQYRAGRPEFVELFRVPRTWSNRAALARVERRLWAR